MKGRSRRPDLCSLTTVSRFACQTICMTVSRTKGTAAHYSAYCMWYLAHPASYLVQMTDNTFRQHFNATNSKTVRPASNQNPYALPLQLTPPGTLTAHGKSYLVLLCSQPDTVRKHPLRKTQTSTPLIKGSHTGTSPLPDITPAIADFRYRGPLIPRLHGFISILAFLRFVKLLLTVPVFSFFVLPSPAHAIL